MTKNGRTKKQVPTKKQGHLRGVGILRSTLNRFDERIKQALDEAIRQECATHHAGCVRARRALVAHVQTDETLGASMTARNLVAAVRARLHPNSWRWSAVMDEHTCLRCAELHEQWLALDPNPPLSQLPPHPYCESPLGCRCMVERSGRWR